MTDAVLLVVMEPGARLPRAVHELRQRRPDHVVIIAGESFRDLALRVASRVHGLREMGGRIERGVLVLSPGSPGWSRVLGRILVAGLKACSGRELLLIQSDGSSSSAREELFELTEQLLQTSRRIPIHVHVTVP